MKQHQQGSSILLTLLLLSALVLFSLVVWKQTTFSLDLVHMRLCYEQQLRATELMLNYGIALCKENAQALSLEGKKGEKEVRILCDQVPVQGEVYGKGVLKIGIMDSYFQLRAALIIAEKEVCVIHCELHHGKSDHMKVAHWGIDATA